MNLDVAIVGGGLAGLGCARFLKEAGFSVAVFEKENHPGGKVQTMREEGFVVELGPLGWLDKEAAVHDFVKGLSLKPLAAAAAQKHRFLLQHGKLQALPSGPGSFMRTPLLSMRDKIRLLGEPFIRPRRQGEECIHDFATRRFGLGVAETFFGAMVSGVFGGDARALSVQAAFPLMAGWEFESGSCMRGALRHMRNKRREEKSGTLATTTGNLCSLPEGMAGLVEAAAHSFGNRYFSGTSIDSVRRRGKVWALIKKGKELACAPHLVLATPALHAAGMLGSDFSSLSRAAKGIRGASLFVVAAAYTREQVENPLQSFGFIALREQGFRPLGVQYASSIFPSQTPEGMVQLRVLLGGAFDPQAAALSDAALRAACLNPLEGLLGIHGNPRKVWQRRIAGGIPQYTVGHLGRVAAFDKAQASVAGLYFAGDSLHGVGVNAVLKRARKVADEVAENLKSE